uniref:EGF-like domain-containing protein n=1 Tax=Hucho hucho TaxID=62062 RepID=A0A4W5QLT4_9TELE
MTSPNNILLFPDTNQCSSKSCIVNSTCIETGQGGYLCICPPGYTGESCHLKKEPCLTSGSPCQNGGTCADAAYPPCACPLGFAGDFCEIDTDSCDPNPCLNGGNCTDHGPAFACACPTGFNGPTCNDTHVDTLSPCSRAPCGNGGTCVVGTLPAKTTAYPLCACALGFPGNFCDTDSCDPNPCLNGGNCTDHGPIRAPCGNGGTCMVRSQTDRIGTYHCLCLPGFTITGHECTPTQQPHRPKVKLRPPKLSPPHYSVPAHVFHKLLRPPERDLLKITPKETVHTPSAASLFTRSQLLCFGMLGLLSCMVILGTTFIIFFNRCETWMANAKYSHLVRQQKEHLLIANNGDYEGGHSANFILPEIELTSFGKHYTSI